MLPRNLPFVAALAAALLSAPAVLAHVDGAPAGTPKRYCEDVTGDTDVHEYAPLAVGRYVFLPMDGALQPCPYSAGGTNPFYDGHLEFAQGGTFFVAGDGTACGWDYPDHLPFPTVHVLDDVLAGSYDVAGRKIGLQAPFTVGSDVLNNVPPVNPEEPNCGDLSTDVMIQCVGSCAVPFPPGLDGTYQVLVTGTAGHAWTA